MRRLPFQFDAAPSAAYEGGDCVEIGQSRSGSSGASDQIPLQRVMNELGAIAQAELLEDVVEVRLHRSLGDGEPLGHLGIRLAERHQTNDLRLSPGELRIG